MKKPQYMEPYTRPRQIYISNEMWEWLRNTYPTASEGVRRLVAEAMEKEETGKLPETEN
jgi:hypothetical protein